MPVIHWGMDMQASQEGEPSDDSGPRHEATESSGDRAVGDAGDSAQVGSSADVDRGDVDASAGAVEADQVQEAFPAQLLAVLSAPARSDARLLPMVVRCRDLPPGPELVTELLGLDVARISAADRLEVMLAWQRVTNWVSAQFHLAVAAVAGPLSRSAATAIGDAYSLTGDEVDDVVCGEIGAALLVTPHAAVSVVERARAAAGHLAPITERMLAGDLGEAHLARAVALCADAPPEVAHEAAAEVAAKAPRCTPSQLRGRLLRAVVKRDPNAIQRRVRAAQRDRGVALWSDPDLRGRLDVHGPWPAVNRAHRQLTDWAHWRKRALRDLRRQHPKARLCCPEAVAASVKAANVVAGECGRGGTKASAQAGGNSLRRPDQSRAGNVAGAGTSLTVSQARDVLALDPVAGCRWCDAAFDSGLPSVDQLRADALIEACELLGESLAAATGGGPAGEVPPLPPRRGRRWSHAVVVVDLPTALGLADEPGWVPGYGHVPASIARELAAGASHWQRFLLDEEQQLISTGRFTYRPSDRLRELVTARDHTCTFPGCGRPAESADLDHRENFDGGNTTAENLHPLCRTHHRLKTHAGWSVRRTTGGRHTWTSPLGREYITEPQAPWMPDCREPEGPARRDLDGPDGRDLDGPTRRDLDGPVGRDPDGPTRRDLDGPARPNPEEAD